jgi:hypothetical protein
MRASSNPRRADHRRRGPRTRGTFRIAAAVALLERLTLADLAARRAARRTEEIIMAQQVVREIVIRGKVEGVDGITSALDRVAAAQSRVSQSSEVLARAQVSVERRQAASAAPTIDSSGASTPVANAMAKMERATSLADRAVATGRASLESAIRCSTWRRAGTGSPRRRTTT